MDYDLKYPWQQSVLEAFMASPDSLGPKIAIAQRAISARLARSHIDPEEHLALHDALRALGVLTQETKPRTRPVHQQKQEDIA